MCSPYGSARSTECDNIRNARRWPSRHAPTISPELHPRQPSFSFLLLLLFLLLPHRRRLASLLTSDRWFTREDLLLARFYERLWPATETRREQRPSLPRTKNRFLRDSAQFRVPVIFLESSSATLRAREVVGCTSNVRSALALPPKEECRRANRSIRVGHLHYSDGWILDLLAAQSIPRLRLSRIKLLSTNVRYLDVIYIISEKAECPTYRRSSCFE